jgi:paraquat-inducible protein A
MLPHPSNPDAALPVPGNMAGADDPAPTHVHSGAVAVPRRIGSGPVSSLIALYPYHVHVPVLLVAAAVTLAFGLTMPVMTVEKAYFWQDDYTLVTGASGLWTKGERFLATVLLLFSGVFPVLKLLMLGALLVLPMRPRGRARLIAFTDALGRWSMLDVFVVAMFIVLARSALIAKAAPAPGLYVFCGAIVASMLLSMELHRLARRASAP